MEVQNMCVFRMTEYMNFQDQHHNILLYLNQKAKAPICDVIKWQSLEKLY